MTLSTPNLWVLVGRQTDNQNLRQCFLFYDDWDGRKTMQVSVGPPFAIQLAFKFSLILVQLFCRTYLSLRPRSGLWFLTNLHNFSSKSSNAAFTRGCTAQHGPHSYWSRCYGGSVLISFRNTCRNMHVMTAEYERKAVSYPYRNPDLARDDSWLVWLVQSWLNYEETQAAR